MHSVESKIELRNQVKHDLESYAKEKDLSIRELIKKMSVEIPLKIRNLERIIGVSDTYPSSQTLEKIYSYIYECDNLIELMIKVPFLVSERFKSDFIINSKSKMSVKISEEVVALSRCDLFNRIYLLTAGDFGVSLEFLKVEFGNVGLKMAEKMVFFGILKIDDEENFTRGITLITHIEIRKNILNTAIKDYNLNDNDIEGKNYLGAFVGDIAIDEYDDFYNEIKEFFHGLSSRLKESKPNKNNSRKIVFGGILDQVGIKTNSDSAEEGI